MSLFYTLSGGLSSLPFTSISRDSSRFLNVVVTISMTTISRGIEENNPEKQLVEAPFCIAAFNIETCCV